MAKYRKALYISFIAESSSILYGQQGKSYFNQKDKSLDRKYQIRMYGNRPRRALFDKDIPFIRINYLYEENHKLPSADWRVHHILSNIEFANKVISEGLQSIEPNSIIYINAHGSRENMYLSQHINYPNEDNYATGKISYLQIADLLSNNIRVSNRTNITIKLLSCKPLKFAKELMNLLDKSGFKKTCVVYATTISSIYSPFTKVSKNHFLLKDCSSRERSSNIGLVFRGKFRFGEEYPDIKRVCHNYSGTVQDEPSRDFKKKYMQFNEVVQISRGIDELNEFQEEFILLQNILFQTLANYLNNYEQSSYHGIIHRHGSSGHKRVMYFCEQINSISTESIVNGEIISEDAIIKILSEIKSFASRNGNYSRYSGRISVNNNSGMTFIIRGLETFYEMSGFQIKSPILNNFFSQVGSQNIENQDTRLIYLNKINTFKL